MTIAAALSLMSTSAWKIRSRRRPPKGRVTAHRRQDRVAGQGSLRRPEIAPAEAAGPAAKVEWNRDYSPYAGRKYPMHVYFGDTHHHTANSGDAFMDGDRLGRRILSLRARRAGHVVIGIPAEILAAVGFPRYLRPCRRARDDVRGLRGQSRLWRPANVALAGDAARGGRGRGGDRTNWCQGSRRTLPAVVKDPQIVGPLMKSVWKEYLKPPTNTTSPDASPR